MILYFADNLPFKENKRNSCSFSVNAPFSVGTSTKMDGEILLLYCFKMILNSIYAYVFIRKNRR